MRQVTDTLFFADKFLGEARLYDRFRKDVGRRFDDSHNTVCHLRCTQVFQLVHVEAELTVLDLLFCLKSRKRCLTY